MDQPKQLYLPLHLELRTSYLQLSYVIHLVVVNYSRISLTLGGSKDAQNT